MIKTILVTALCLYLAACDETSSTKPVSAANSLEGPIDQPTPTIVWTPPSTPSAIEQSIRGTYFNQANRNSSVTVNPDYSISGSIETINNWHFPDGIFTKPDICTFTGINIRVVQYPGNPNFNLQFTIQTGENYGWDMPRDCPSIRPQGPIDSPSNFDIVAFPSEKCVDLNFATSTGIQHYCRD